MLQEERGRLQSQDKLTGSTVKIAALHALSLQFLPAWLKKVERSFGTIGVSLFTDDFQDSIQRLVEGECDFLFTYYHPMVPVFLDPAKFPHVALGSDRLVLVTGVDVDGLTKMEWQKRLRQWYWRATGSLGYPRVQSETS